MNLKLSASFLALGTLTSAVLLGLAPVSAQTGNGSNNGNNIQFTGGNGSNTTNNVQFTNSGGNSPGGGPVSPQAQAALNQLSQSLSANNVGQGIFDALNGGGNPAGLVDALSPTGVAAGGPTVNAAGALAASLQGLRDSGNGNLNAAKLSPAVDAFNKYVAALVGEVGAEKATAGLTEAQKASGKGEGSTTAQLTLQALLGQAVQAAQTK